MKVARVTWGLALAVAAGSLPSVAQAQGFGLNEIGSCAVARGSAVTAHPCDDASSIYWNPAAPVGLKGLSVLVGAAPISIKGDYTSDVTGRQDKGDIPVEVPPHLFVNWKGGARWALGLGAYVPYGLTSQWKPDFPGRFSAQKASLQTIYVQPNFAFDVVPNRFSIGGGPVFGHSTVELRQSIDLASQLVPGGGGLTFANLGIPTGTEFGRAKLEGDANAWGYHLGAQAHVTPTIDLGVRYLSSLKFEYDDAEATFEQVQTGIIFPAGTLGPTATPIDVVLASQFAPGGALTARPGASAIEHPAQLQGGIAFSGLTRTLLSAEYTRYFWSVFKELPVEFGGADPSPPDRLILEDYEDSWAVRFGAEHKLLTTGMASFANNWALRAGFSYATSPAPDETVTPLLPDMARKNYALGVGIPLGGRFALDASYLRVDTDGRRGRIVERTSRDQTAEELNTGFFRLNDVNILSLSLKASF